MPGDFLELRGVNIVPTSPLSLTGRDRTPGATNDWTSVSIETGRPWISSASSVRSVSDHANG